MSPELCMVRRIIITAAIAGLVCSPLLLAASPDSRKPPVHPGQEAQTARYSNEQLANFSRAYERVKVLDVKWSRKAEQANNDAEIADIRRRANEEMVRAVRNSGLTVETYNEIARASIRDQQLATRIEKINE